MHRNRNGPHGDSVRTTEFQGPTDKGKFIDVIFGHPFQLYELHDWNAVLRQKKRVYRDMVDFDFTREGLQTQIVAAECTYAVLLLDPMSEFI